MTLICVVLIYYKLFDRKNKKLPGSVIIKQKKLNKRVTT